VFYLKRVQRGIDFIEAHLLTDIDVSAVAQAAGLSQWHFQRIFKALTNETLKTYISARRFAMALDQLLNTRMAILDIALAAGFETQASFTRAFKTCFLLTPNQYRKFGHKGQFIKKLSIDTNYMRHLHGNLILEPEIGARKKMQLIGLRTPFFGVDSEKNNVAKQLPPLWTAFMSRIGEVRHTIPGTCYGVIQPVSPRSAQLQYYAAIEVSKVESLPAGMVSLELGPATYAAFSHKGFAQELDHTVNYIYSNWMLASEWRHASGPDLEICGVDFETDSASSLMHYAIPIEKTKSTTEAE
jgi:AraC family transcriptional regulator